MNQHDPEHLFLEVGVKWKRIAQKIVDARDRLDIATEKIHAADHFSDGIDDVRQIQIARRDLVEHGSEEKKVLAIDDRDFESRIVALLEFQRGIKPAEAAAENQDTCLVWHTHPFVAKGA